MVNVSPLPLMRESLLRCSTDMPRILLARSGVMSAQCLNTSFNSALLAKASPENFCLRKLARTLFFCFVLFSRVQRALALSIKIMCHKPPQSWLTARAGRGLKWWVLSGHTHARINSPRTVSQVSNSIALIDSMHTIRMSIWRLLHVLVRYSAGMLTFTLNITKRLQRSHLGTISSNKI